MDHSSAFGEPPLAVASGWEQDGGQPVDVALCSSRVGSARVPGKRVQGPLHMVGSVPRWVGLSVPQIPSVFAMATVTLGQTIFTCQK